MKKINHTTAIIILMFLLLFCSKNIYAEDTTWQNDYKYSLDETNHYIILEKYTGSEKGIIIPANATIGDVEYTTYIEGGQTAYDSRWPGVNWISFNEGIVLGNDLSRLFYNCVDLEDLDLKNFDTSNVTDMSYMFSGCTSLTSIDLHYIKTSNVENMNSMFRGCTSLTSYNFTRINTSKVTDMSYMFSGCRDLKDLDLDNLNTSSVKDMSHMFDGCDSLISIMAPLWLTVDAALPGTFYDKAGNAYTELPKGLDLSILLTNTPPVGAGIPADNNAPGVSAPGVLTPGVSMNSKQDQPMEVKVVKKTVKYKKLKKKAQTIKPITVKAAQGTVSYKITGGNKKSKKALKVNSKTGKITVKKKTKRGTYKVKVKVTAAGNKSYNAGSKTVAVKIVVK